MFYAGLVFLGLGAAAWAIYHYFIRIPRMPCFFDAAFGIYCPGCGGTRALKALFHGRGLEAVWYHPLIPYTAAVGGGFMVTQGLERLGVRRVKGWKYHSWYLYVGIGLIVLNFIGKNMLRLIWGITM